MGRRKWRCCCRWRKPYTYQLCLKPGEAVEGAAFIQESVPERLPLKIETFQRIEPPADDAIVATSASGLLIKDMQDGWQDPSRFLLGHPFNPPHLIPLVELLGNEADPDAIDRAAAFYRSAAR